MNISVNYSLKIQLSLLKSYAVRFIKRRHAGNSLFLPDADKIWQLPKNFGVIVVLGWLPLFSKHSLAHGKIIIAVEGLNGPFKPGDLNLALTRCSLPGTFKLFHYCSLVWQFHLNKQNHFMIKWRFSNIRQCSTVSLHGLWLYVERKKQVISWCTGNTVPKWADSSRENFQSLQALWILTVAEESHICCIVVWVIKFYWRMY